MTRKQTVASYYNICYFRSFFLNLFAYSVAFYEDFYLENVLAIHTLVPD